MKGLLNADSFDYNEYREVDTSYLEMCAQYNWRVMDIWTYRGDTYIIIFNCNQYALTIQHLKINGLIKDSIDTNRVLSDLLSNSNGKLLNSIQNLKKR